MSRVKRGVRIGGYREVEGATLGPLGMEGVLSPHFIITIVNIPIPIVDHPVVIARIGTEARDDNFMVVHQWLFWGRGVRVRASLS